jgi:hypothetical protein
MDAEQRGIEWLRVGSVGTGYARVWVAAGYDESARVAVTRSNEFEWSRVLHPARLSSHGTRKSVLVITRDLRTTQQLSVLPNKRLGHSQRSHVQTNQPLE